MNAGRFLLFLYMQSAPRLSLKGSSSTGDDWPSPETERKQSRFPEAAGLAFIKHHISEILQLLADTGESLLKLYIQHTVWLVIFVGLLFFVGHLSSMKMNLQFCKLPVAYTCTHNIYYDDYVLFPDEASKESYLSVGAMDALEFLVSGSEQDGGYSQLRALACKHQQSSGYSEVRHQCVVHFV